MNFMRRLITKKTGLTYLEYALLAALIIVVAVVVIGNLGTSLQGTMQSVIDQLPP